MVTVERVLSSEGSAYKSNARLDACNELNVVHKRTRPYRPQTNGEIERFQRTLGDGWAYARYYDSETARRDAPARTAALLHHYRHHSATGALPPISRLTELSGHHT